MPCLRNGIWYTDFWAPKPGGGRKRYRLSLGPTVRTERDAAREERRLQAELESPRTFLAPAPADLPAAAFSGFVRKWLDVWGPANTSASTLNRYESICTQHLVPWFGDQEIATITQLDVEEFRAANMRVANQRKPGQVLAKKTVNEHVNVLRSIFKVAAAWGYLKANPTEGVTDLDLPPQRFDFYTQAEAAVFLDTCRDVEPAWFPLLTTGLRTGLRLGELFALDRGDLDFGNRVVHVRRSVTRVADKARKGRSVGVVKMPKSGLERMVPMSVQLRDVLLAHRHMLGDLVFPRVLLEQRGERPEVDAEGPWLTPRMIDRAIARVAKAAGLRRIRPHDMRHSFASQLVIRGVPLRVVQEYLGHSSITTTERYAHLAPVTTHQFVAILDLVEAAIGHNLDTATGGAS